MRKRQRLPLRLGKIDPISSFPLQLVLNGEVNPSGAGSTVRLTGSRGEEDRCFSLLEGAPTGGPGSSSL